MGTSPASVLNCTRKPPDVRFAAELQAVEILSYAKLGKEMETLPIVAAYSIAFLI